MKRRSGRIATVVLFVLVLFALVATGNTAPTRAVEGGQVLKATVSTSSSVENRSGTSILSLRNSRDNWKDSNGSLVLGVDTNRSIIGLSLSFSTFSASENMWWGGWSDLTGATEYQVSNDTAKGRAQQIIPPGRFQINSTWLHMKRYVNGGSGYQNLLIQIAEDDSNLPGAVISNVSANLTAIPTSPSWRSFDSSEYVSVSSPFWVVMNGSFLYDDRACWCMRGDNPQPDGMEAAHNGIVWASAAPWDAMAMVRGKCLNEAGTASWTGKGSDLRCNVTVDGDHTSRVASSSVLLNSSDVRDGRVVLAFQSNISASAEVSWIWLFKPISNATEPVEDDVTAEVPWVFATKRDWLLVCMSLLTMVTVLLYLIHGRAGLLWGLAVMFAFSASWTLVSLRWGDWMQFFIGKVNDFTMRYGWYVFWQGAIAVAASVGMAYVREEPRRGHKALSKQQMWMKRAKIGMGALGVAGVTFAVWVFMSWATASFLTELVIHQNYVTAAVRALADDIWIRSRRILW